MNSVRRKGAGKLRLWFLMAWMLCLGGCGQMEKGMQNGAIGTPKDNCGYFSEVYSLDACDTNVGCVTGDCFFFVEEEYQMNEAGQIQIISILYQHNWRQKEAMQQEGDVQPDAGGQELGRIEASVRYIAADATGNLYLLIESWREQEVVHGIVLWNPSDMRKNSVKETPLEECPVQTPVGFAAMDGVALLWDHNQLCAYDGDGKLIWTFAETEILDACPGDDSLWVCLRTNQGNKTAIAELDFQKGSAMRRWDNIDPFDIEQIAWKAEGELWFLNARTGIAVYQTDTDAYQQIFSWMDAGAAELILYNVIAEENQICVFAKDKISDEYQIHVISYGELPKEQDKQEIVFAMQWMSDTVKRAIVEFNRTHSEYRIVAKTCTEQEYYEDYCKKIDMEIMAGEGADLFVLPVESFENYRSKGLLLDLAPYFAKDDTMNIDAYVEKAWERYRVGDSLYATPTGFSLTTAVGRRSVLGEQQPWTIAEMMNTVREEAGITELFCDGTKEDVLLYCCRGLLLQEGVIDFEDGIFMEMLEFANQYGRDARDISEDRGMYHLLREESLLMEADFYDVDSVARYKALCDDDICAVGYPSKEPVLCYLNASNGLAIRANSPYAEQAWELIKLLLSENYQEQQESFSVLKMVLEQQLEKAMNGKTGGDSVLSGMIINGEYLEVMSPEPQDAAFVQNMIENSKPYPYEMDEICKIVLEEAGSYFAGQKTASEVTHIIQNRVYIFFEERKK